MLVSRREAALRRAAERSRNHLGMVTDDTGDRPRSRPHRNHLRLFGRILGGLAAIWWTTTVVAGVLAGPDPNAMDDAIWESVGVVVLALANTAAFAVALVRESIGSKLMVCTGAAFCAFAFMSAGRNQLFAAAVSGAPFIASGCLIWLADRGGTSPGRTPMG